MRILYHGLVELDTHTAPAVHTRMICEALAANGHEVLLACPGARGIAHPRGVQMAPLPFLGFSTTRLVLYREVGGRSIAKAARRFRPDVIVDRMSPMLPKLVDLARKLDVPLAVEVNGRMAKKDYLFGQTIKHALRRAFSRQSLSIIGCSPGIEAELQEDLGHSAPLPFHVVENGVSPFFARSGPNPERQDLGIPDNRFVVGFLGHFNRAYDFEGMLAGCRNAVDRGLDLHFYLGASPDLQEEFVRIATELDLSDRLTCGPIVPHKKVAGLLRTFDAGIVHLVPERAHMSPTAFKLREMLLCGVPMLCDVTEDWKNWPLEPGIFPLRNAGPEEIGAQLIRIASDPEAAVVRTQAGAQILQERYSWRTIADQYAQALRIDEPTPPAPARASDPTSV